MGPPLPTQPVQTAPETLCATGGPDLVRKIFPTAVTVSAQGAAEVPLADIEAAAHAVIERRTADHSQTGNGEQR